MPIVIRKALAQNNIEDALACITGARLAGAHYPGRFICPNPQPHGSQRHLRPS